MELQKASELEAIIIRQEGEGPKDGAGLAERQNRIRSLEYRGQKKETIGFPI